jgi:hypothetical protein
MEELRSTDVGNEAVTLVGRGHSPTSQLMIQSYRPMDDAIVTNGVVEQSDVSDVQRAFEDPSFLYRGRLDRRRMGSQTAQLALQQHTIPP